MKIQFNHIIRTSLLVFLSSFVCISCTDTWDDHYNADLSVTSDSTLWQEINNNVNLTDFASVLQNVKTFRSHAKTSVSYADLLNADQIFTVWAPVNGTFDKDSLISLCETAKGDSLVEKVFVKNHIARNNHSVSSVTNDSLSLLNTKKVYLTSSDFAGVSMATTNSVASNGILHTLSTDAEYPYSIYERLCSFDKFSGIGNFFLSYQKEELDESSSVSQGINDEGLTVYVDSVMDEENILLDELGYINTEDSTYWMIAPTNNGWNEAYDEARKYFNFAYINKADSLQEYWAKHSLINDAIFNYHSQGSVMDSLISTTYNRRKPELHCFYKPFATGGLLSNYEEKIACSNGYVYQTASWPFSKYDTYFIPITTEAESYGTYMSDHDLCTYNYRSASGDSISNDGYLDIVPEKSTSQWTVTYKIPNTLSGTYDVYVVILPKTVYDASTTDFKPTKYKVTINYNDATGKTEEDAISTKFENDPYKVDSMLVATVTLPTCNYDQDDITVKVSLKCVVGTKEITKYTREVYLDCICLIPHQEDN